MSQNQKPDESIFFRAIEMESDADRSAYLQQACAGDKQLEARIKFLLRANAKSGDLLDIPDTNGAPAIATPLAATGTHEPVTEGPGTVIGPYKLLEQIGEGGFGVVYMAEQQQPIRRRVALKIIKPGMDTREVIARFEAERQALALMDHPHIAKVLDAGTTETGRPYFVMDLVKGIPITNYCDQQKLDSRQRLELYVMVCGAVQHAHQKGIIHRDLKPTNVLVELHDVTSVPKVIDFGVAKAINQQLTERTLFTKFAQMIGTPLYMSPEQAQLTGLDVDTRSDVYSLGVLLYELLTGTTPFDKQTLREAGYDEIRRIIQEDDPPKPSDRISTLNAEALSTISDKRRIDPRKLGQSVRGELDWIVMKALEKDRTRRYETANGLARDIERYLNDEPVEACPPSATYRFRKLARRNRTALTTATVVALSLLVGSSVSIWQAIEANNSGHKTAAALGQSRANFREANRQKTEADEQRKLANQRFKDEQQARKETDAQRKLAESNLQLAMDALDAVYLQAVSRERVFGETDPLAKTKLTDKEKKLLQTGLEFYSRIANQNDSSTEAASATASAFLQIAQLRSNLDDPEGAETALSESIARYKKLTEAFSDNAHCFERLGLAYLRKGKLKQPLEFDKAVAAFNEALAIDPDHWPAYKHRGDVYRHLQQYDKALADHLQALEFQPDNDDTLNLLFQTYSDLQQNDKAVAYLDQRIAADPSNVDFYIRRGSLRVQQERTFRQRAG